MGRESREERQIKRAREELATLLRRGDAEGALAALLKLPARERETQLEPLAGLVRRSVTAAFTAQDWTRLTRFGTLIEREGRLPAAGAVAQSEVHEAHWALMWGCIRRGDWDRAGRWFAACRGAIPNAQVTAALAALVEARGAPGGGALDALASATDAVARPTDAPRLGYDPGQVRGRAATGLPPPASAGDVEPSLVAVFARQGWNGFLATVERWSRAANPVVARPLRILAARLAVRELLNRARQTPSSVAEPALFIAGVCAEADGAAELETELLLALRVATAALGAHEPAPREAVRLYVSVAKAAIRSQALLPLVAGTVESTLFAVDARPFILDLLRDLHERAPTAALWLKACALWRVPDETGNLPGWLVSGLAKVLDRGDELRAAAQNAPPRTVRLTFEALVENFPLALAGRALDRLWNEDSPEWCGGLARAFATLLERACEEGTTPHGEATSAVRTVMHSMLHASGDCDFTEADLSAFLASPEGRALRRKAEAMMGRRNDERLPASAFPLWRQFRDRVVPYSVDLLETALINSASPGEDNDAVLRFAGRRSSAVQLLEAGRQAHVRGCARAAAALDDLLFARHGRDPEGLARCLLVAGKRGASTQFKRDLARALVDAVRETPAGAGMSDTVAAGLVEARLWDKRRTSRPKAAKKPKNKQAAAGEPGGTGSNRSSRRKASPSSDAPTQLSFAEPWTGPDEKDVP